MYCVLYFTLEKKNISDWPKSGPVETGPTGPVATPLAYHTRMIRSAVNAYSPDPTCTVYDVTSVSACLIFDTVG